MSDTSNTGREKRGWFRRSRPIDVSQLTGQPASSGAARPDAAVRPTDGRAPKRSGDMFRSVENGDAWSSSAWAEDGWDDDWSDPSTRRASVRPAADPRPEEVDAWLESGSSDFAEVTRDIAERWVGRAGRNPVPTPPSEPSPSPRVEVDTRRKGLSLDLLRSSIPAPPVEFPETSLEAPIVAETPAATDSDVIPDAGELTHPTATDVDSAGAFSHLSDFSEEDDDATQFHGSDWNRTVDRADPVEATDGAFHPGFVDEDTALDDAADDQAIAAWTLASEERSPAEPDTAVGTEDVAGAVVVGGDVDAAGAEDVVDVEDVVTPGATWGELAVTPESVAEESATPAAVEPEGGIVDSVVPPAADTTDKVFATPTLFESEPAGPTHSRIDALALANFEDLDLASDGDLDDVDNTPHDETASDAANPATRGSLDEPVVPDASNAGHDFPEELAPADPFPSVLALDDVDAEFARGPAFDRPVDRHDDQHDDADLEDDDLDNDADIEDDERFDGEYDDELDDDDWDDPVPVGTAAHALVRQEDLRSVEAGQSIARAARAGTPSSRFCTTTGTGIVLVASLRMLLGLASGMVTSEGAGADRLDVVNRIGTAFTGLGLFHGLALTMGAALLALPRLLGDDDSRRHDSRAASMLGITGGAAIAGIVGGLLGVRAGLHGIDATATDWIRIIGDAVAIAGSSLVAFSAALQAIRIRSR